MTTHKVYRSQDGHRFACALAVGTGREEWEAVTCPDCLARKDAPVDNAPRGGQVTEPIDLLALRARLREYDPTVPRCKGTIVEERDFAPDYASEEGRAEWQMTFRHPCGRPEGHEGDCRSGRSVLGWPGHATLTALLDEIERLREECHTLRLWAEEAARAENANAEDAKQERADVVAWLQAEAQRMYEAGQDRPAWFTLSNRAERIERGEHRREEEK